MPLYEYQCGACGAREEVFARTMSADVKTPACPSGEAGDGHAMQRLFSPFARHRTMADQLAEAEAKYGQEVDAAMGPEPDVGRMARRYDSLARDLPAATDL